MPLFEELNRKDTNLYPVVKIGSPGENEIYISTNPVHFNDIYCLPILLNIPSLKESIDIETRKYKISSVTLNISNYKADGKRFSNLINSSLINKPVDIYWAAIKNSETNTSHRSVYKGSIRRYDMDGDNVKITVEDRSQATLHKDLPLPDDWLGSEDVIPDKYKLKPLPMVYGDVDRSPCVIRHAPAADDFGIDSGNIDILIDQDGVGSSSVGSSPLSIYINDKHLIIPYDVDADALLSGYTGEIHGYPQNTIQYTTANNIIQLISYINTDNDEERNPISNNSIIGYEYLESEMVITPMQTKSIYWSGQWENRTWYTSLGVDLLGSTGTIMGSLFREPDDGDWSGTSYLQYITETQTTGEDIDCCGAFYNDPGRDDKHEATLVGCEIKTGAGSFGNVEGILFYTIKTWIGNTNTWDGGVFNYIKLRVGGYSQGDISEEHSMYVNYGGGGNYLSDTWELPNNYLLTGSGKIFDSENLLIYL